MKIKLLVSRSGPEGAFNVGDVIEVPNAEAQRMVDAEQAVILRSGKKPEKAVKA